MIHLENPILCFCQPKNSKRFRPPNLLRSRATCILIWFQINANDLKLNKFLFSPNWPNKHRQLLYKLYIYIYSSICFPRFLAFIPYTPHITVVYKQIPYNVQLLFIFILSIWNEIIFDLCVGDCMSHVAVDGLLWWVCHKYTQHPFL